MGNVYDDGYLDCCVEIYPVGEDLPLWKVMGRVRDVVVIFLAVAEQHTTERFSDCSDDRYMLTVIDL